MTIVSYYIRSLSKYSRQPPSVFLSICSPLYWLKRTVFFTMNKTLPHWVWNVLIKYLTWRCILAFKVHLWNQSPLSHGVTFYPNKIQICTSTVKYIYSKLFSENLFEQIDIQNFVLAFEVRSNDRVWDVFRLWTIPPSVYYFITFSHESTN